MREQIHRIGGVAAALAAAVSLMVAATAWSEETPGQTRQILALTYPEGPTISVKFWGTSRLPLASGEAKVERKRGMTEIEIELDEMKPATSFGGDYNTYVLWIVSPEGHVDNTGEFILQGNRSKLNVSTPLETFGMFVSAEPHFLVSLPSRFVVLENTSPTVNMGPRKVSELRYEGFDGVYEFESESLADAAEAKGEIRTHIESARTSVELAERAGAAEFAAEELARAREALQEAEAAVSASAGGRNEMLAAHDVIRLATDAEKRARQRAFESALAREREANEQRISELKASIGAAESSAERNRLKAEQEALDAELEAKARREAERQAAEAAQRAAEADARALKAQRERVAAEEAKIEAERAKIDAESDRLAAEREAEKARGELREALARIAAVRDSARGLIVSLPNILFEFDRAALKPEGREALAKISGLLAVARGFTLSVEGHTDDVGSPDYNLSLSRERAQSVRDYLVAQGLDPERILVKGFGESQPRASNETAEGRQENRRVERVVVEAPDFGFGTSSE